MCLFRAQDCYGREFLQIHFVDKGLAAQFDIHEPHDTVDHNWHSHVLMTTRRFTHDGLHLGDKARDLDGDVRGGILVEAQLWGELWRDFQNDYFKTHGIDLQVDENGIVPQAHLGPVRLGARGEDMMKSHLECLHANQNASRYPARILKHLTDRNSFFTRNDVERYLRKHLSANEVVAVRDAFWRQKGLIQLFDTQESSTKKALSSEGEIKHNRETHVLPKTLNRYTTLFVKKEEDRILRIADRLHTKDGFFGLTSNYTKGATIAQNYSLSAEQYCV